MKPLNEQETNQVREELEEIKLILDRYDFSMNEDAWTTIYTDIKGYENVSFSPTEFDDIIQDGVGIEVKKRKKDPGEIDQGDQIYHPSITRSVDDPEDLDNLDLEERKEYYLNALRRKFKQWASKVNETIGVEGHENADIRWGVLLHSEDHCRWAYWESEVEYPHPDDFFAVETDAGHLAIYEEGRNPKSDKPKYQPMTGSDSDRIETHFTVPENENVNRIDLKKMSEPDEEEFVRMHVLPEVYDDFDRVLGRQHDEEDDLETDSDRIAFLVNQIRRQTGLDEYL